MKPSHRSYAKTCLPTAVFAFAAGALALSPATAIHQLVGAAAWLACGVATMVTLAGLIVLWRDVTTSTGGDLFLRLNRSRSEESLTRNGPGLLPRCLVAAWPRRLQRLRVGDDVEVLSLAEIQQTLDVAGSLDGLPFQPEMAAYCGQRFRVYRRVDKIYDYRRTRKMRRLTRAVSLIGVRCDGSAHGACQAQCYLIWKDAWLRRAPWPGQGATRTASQVSRRDQAERRSDQSPSTRHGLPFACQFTQLAAASRPMSAWDVRQDLRPLLAGNVTLSAFAVAVLTRFFNRVQALRHGAPFPAAPPGQPSASMVTSSFSLGERVRVRSAQEIADTLDARGRHRGLWFDLDMLKHCGRRYEVKARVERIIDAATGRMLVMKTPCLILDGVVGSGEFLRFCPQEEPIFWREIWLRPDQ